LICVPGFIGDALGLLVMVGPVRHFVIRASAHRLARRLGRTRTSAWRVVDVAPRSEPQMSPRSELPGPSSRGPE